jgi:ERO1-like protein beta
LKVLFEFDNDSEDIPMLKRTELVALFNTLARISSSLEGIGKFRAMVEAEESSSSSSPVFPDRVTKPHHVVPDKKPSTSSDDEFAEHEREELMRRKALPANASLKEAIYSEVDLMWRVTKYVLRGWVMFPFKM